MPFIRCYCADCLEMLPRLPATSVDAVVTDPPFTAAGGSTTGRNELPDTQFFAHWWRAVADALKRVLKPSGCAFVHCDWRTLHVVAAGIHGCTETSTSKPWTVTQALVWDREGTGLGSPFRNTYEMIAFARGPTWKNALPKDISTIIRCRWPYGRHAHHGAEKPVELARLLVCWACPPGGVVLDPFAGSGTTGRACALEGRNCILIEREPEYTKIARQRCLTVAGASDTLSGESRGVPREGRKESPR